MLLSLDLASVHMSEKASSQNAHQGVDKGHYECRIDIDPVTGGINIQCKSSLSSL